MTNELAQQKYSNIKHYCEIYIYIYIEREREREREIDFVFPFFYLVICESNLKVIFSVIN